MITISNLAFDPKTADCGDTVEISAKVSFAGRARRVGATVTIQDSCTLDGGSSVNGSSSGPSPQTLRVVAAVSCPAGTRRPAITVRVRDTHGNEDETSKRLEVRC